MTKIIIHVSGGVVQWVASDKDVKIAIVDMDQLEIGEDEERSIQISDQDTSIDEAYNLPNADAMDLRIKEYLKENEF